MTAYLLAHLVGDPQLLAQGDMDDPLVDEGLGAGGPAPSTAQTCRSPG